MSVDSRQRKKGTTSVAGDSFEAISRDFKRVVVVNPVRTLWSYQFSLEASIRLASLGAEVLFLDLAKSEDASYLLNEKQYIPRLRYISVFHSVKKELKKFGVPSRSISMRDYYFTNVPKFNNVSELRNYEYGNLKFGAMIYSAITSKYKSTSFEIDEVDKDVNHYFRCTAAAYRKLTSQIRDFAPDVILTTNDRLIGSALALNLASNLGLPSRVIYWGSDSTKLQVYTRSLYDSREWFELAKSKFLISPPSPSEKVRLLNEMDLLSRSQTEDSLTFTRTQTKGLGLELSRKTIVFYAQSEHEHSAVFIDEINGRFKSQQDAFVELMKICGELDIDLVLKYHPIRNLDKRSTNLKSEIGDWKDIQIENWVIQIDPNSKVDTYELINNAYVNVVWTSTVGLESILRQKKLIVLGDTHWLDLDWGINAWNSNDLKRAILGELKVPPLESLLPWFWYIQEFGLKFVHTSLIDGFLYLGDGQEVLKKRLIFRLLGKFGL
jgi:hypothetical protein